MATTITRDNGARNHRVTEDTENGASCFLVDPWHERSAPPCPLFLSVSFVTRWFERGLAAGPRARRSVGALGDRAALDRVSLRAWLGDRDGRMARVESWRNSTVSSHRNTHWARGGTLAEKPL